MNELSIRITSDHFHEWTGAELKRKIAQVTRAAAFKTQALAQGNIQSNGTIETGAMLNGVYVETPGHDEYGSAAGVVESRRRGHAIAHESALDGSELDAAVICAADYSWIIEFGGVGRRAYPFLLPAHDKITAELEEIGRKLLGE